MHCMAAAAVVRRLKLWHVDGMALYRQQCSAVSRSAVALCMPSGPVALCLC
jgi:hypothetical protein